MPQDAQEQSDLENNDQTVEELDTAASNDPIDGATNLAEYNALLEKGLEPQADAAEETETEEVDEDAGNGETTEETEETEEEAEAEEVEETAEEEAETTEEETQRAQDRFRIRAKDEVEATALALKKQNPTWSLTECLEKSSVIHGKKEEAAEQQQDAGPKTVDEAKAAIARLRAEKADAFDNLEFAKANQLDAQIDDLRDAIDSLREKEIRAGQLEQAAFDDKVTSSKQKAVSIYPDSGKPDSPLVKRMKEIDAQLEADENPLHFSPEKPFKLAQMAANDLGIAPRNPKAVQPAKKQVAGTRRPVQPASGNNRTTAPTSPTDKLDQAVADVKDEASYEKLLAEVSSQ